MNRGGLQKSPVQQMMSSGSCPNWWNMMNNNTRPQQTSANTVSNSFLAPNSPNLLLLPHFSPTILPPSSSLPMPTNPWIDNQDQFPESWSQLLVGGLVGEEDKSALRDMQVKKLENNWEEELFENQAGHDNIDAKQKSLVNSYNMYHEHVNNNGDFHHQMMPISSPKSCVTTLTTNNMLDFSNNSHPPPDHSSECNSRVTGGAPNKKARVQASTTQSTFKVRKEKLGDRITALHQLVSPFGKTDTASVLLEAIGYIRFLQSQIEALSLPYLGNGSGNIRQQHHQQCVQGERNSLFPEDPGQLSNDNCLKRKVTSEQDYDDDEEAKKDLRSRGLCLVPISCTLQVGSDNGADYWAPALGGGFR